MKASELFGALIRVMGIYFLLESLGNVLMIVLKSLKISTGSPYPIATDWVGFGERFCFALVLLLGAELIVKMVYRRTSAVR